jgi:hypothetical protein
MRTWIQIKCLSRCLIDVFIYNDVRMIASASQSDSPDKDSLIWEKVECAFSFPPKIIGHARKTKRTKWHREPWYWATTSWSADLTGIVSCQKHKSWCFRKCGVQGAIIYWENPISCVRNFLLAANLMTSTFCFDAMACIAVDVAVKAGQWQPCLLRFADARTKHLQFSTLSSNSVIVIQLFVFWTCLSKGEIEKSSRIVGRRAAVMLCHLARRTPLFPPMAMLCALLKHNHPIILLFLNSHHVFHVKHISSHDNIFWRQNSNHTQYRSIETTQPYKSIYLWINW